MKQRRSSPRRGQTTRRLHCLALGIVAVATAGCAPRFFGTMSSDRPPIERSVLEQLHGAKRVGVMPLSFAKVRFRLGDQELTEDQAFEGKREEKRASWNEDKNAMVEIFAQATGTAERPLALSQVASIDTATDLDFVVAPEAVLVDPGYFATYLFNAEALLVVRYEVIRVSDKKSVLQWTEREESNAGAASGTRLRNAARRMGTGAFLTLRAMARPSLAGMSPAVPAQEAK